ncbi:glucose-1-phosphate adenylyltransferase subunit GlgD [Halalkalibacter hemicellulosilyticus]|uniref:Glycogen biosynthesis protein GlgD n=1 Tax=Halalkalibacter hemicellulosilyticusJCM 9152 TaxID=1236971 RepID=W4QEI6_9BACI|nr:glucose-1-phosphate adenylyltransferase subunit GlgD [Halalkalibacter hemicellulosilyticus]GAE30451.1 glycogen biosynthesis protein GlgD [Halalkalibacter hemicellulosilyticusJCM 9152]
MDTMMGVINLENERDFLNELTYFRCGAAVPFAGRYRLIDFTLSNMVQSDITEVAIFTRNKYRSLMDHLGTGADWNLDRRYGGLFILPPDWNDPTDISKGDLRHFHNNRDYFERSNSDYILISGSQFVATCDYKEAFQLHLETNADVTLITTYISENKPEHQAYMRIEQDEHNRVTHMTHDKTNPQLFTGAYIITKKCLMKLVDQCIAYHQENLFTNGIIDNLDSLIVQSYDHRGYSSFINSIESYYRHNMHLLSANHYKNLFYQNPFVLTKISNEPPTKYRKEAKVMSSLLANGCDIKGNIKNSVLFRGVKVQEGATIKNSIIMQNCTVQANAYLENVILDKDVNISEGQTLVGSVDKPYVVPKRKIV